MSSVNVVTWNVLHRVHALNWGEDAIKSHPDEGGRTRSVVAKVSGWINTGAADVVALQEVSGDLLSALMGACGAGVFAHRFPRLPRVRNGQSSGLIDATEHLVIVTACPATLFAAETFRSDPGKGFVGIEVAEGRRLFGCHVSFGEPRKAQLARLVEFATASPRGAVIMGDFNAPTSDVVAAFGTSATLATLPTGQETRLRGGGKGGSVIDHVAVFGGRVEEACVRDGEGLSDHQPVIARVIFP